MNLLHFIEEFTTDNLLKKTSSRREVFSTFGNLGKKAAIAAVPFGLASTKAKAAFAQDGNAAVNALQLALTLEYLEAEFYLKALDSGVLMSTRAEAVYAQISKHESAHVDFLREGLGDDAVESPEFDFTAGGSFDPFNENGAGQEVAYAQLLALAQAFEDTGVRAYKGQAGNLMGTQFLTPALQIHSVEARHAAEIRRLRANVLNANTDQNALGWITLNQRGPGMPEATQDVYNGEENLTQGGVNCKDVTLTKANVNFRIYKDNVEQVEDGKAERDWRHEFVNLKTIYDNWYEKSDKTGEKNHLEGILFTVLENPINSVL